MRWRLTYLIKKLRASTKESSSLWIAYGLFTAAPGLAWSGADILITLPAKKSTCTRNEPMQRVDESVIGTNYHLGICSWFYLFFHISPVHPPKIYSFCQAAPHAWLRSKTPYCISMYTLKTAEKGDFWSLFVSTIVLKIRKLKTCTGEKGSDKGLLVCTCSHAKCVRRRRKHRFEKMFAFIFHSAWLFPM